MKIVSRTGSLTAARYVITFGNFDGVHSGHASLLKKLKETAERFKAKSLLISFDRHTRGSKLLNTTAERSELLKQHGLDVNLIYDFDKIRTLSYQDFLKKLTGEIKIEALVASDKMRIGHERKGTPAKITQWFMKNHPEAEVKFAASLSSNKTVISSTKIRTLLLKGFVKEAAELLGRSYSVSGRVIKGKKLGRTLGFPTMNLEIPADKIIPAQGVYAVKVAARSKLFQGMAFIGSAWPDGRLTLEANLFGFQKENYNENVTIEFIQHIRKPVKIKSKDELIALLNADKKACVKFFNRP